MSRDLSSSCHRLPAGSPSVVVVSTTSFYDVKKSIIKSHRLLLRSPCCRRLSGLENKNWKKRWCSTLESQHGQALVCLSELSPEKADLTKKGWIKLYTFHPHQRNYQHKLIMLVPFPFGLLCTRKNGPFFVRMWRSNGTPSTCDGTMFANCSYWEKDWYWLIV